MKKEISQLANQAETSFLAGAQWRVLRALKQISINNQQLTISNQAIYQLLHPSKLIEVILPIEFKGKTYLCIGFRAWFDNGKVHKPGQIVKGGIRFLSVKPKIKGKILTIADENAARKLAIDDVSALGLEMLAKNSGTGFVKNILQHFNLAKKKKALKALDLVGGAKGVIVAPRSLHEKDHNEFVRKALEVFGYKLGVMGIVGWDRDVPAGDIGTTGSTASGSVQDGFADGYQKALEALKVKMLKNLQLAVVTGKTANAKYKGNPARAIATGFGTVEALKAWANYKKVKIQDLIVVFDGAGNAALPAAKFLIQSKIKVVGMTDSRSAVLISKGLSVSDLEEISKIKLQRKSLSDWANLINKVNANKCRDFTGESDSLENSKVKLWQNSGMNVLFVSSDAMIINANNVNFLPKNILIVDGANGPVTPKAELQLPKKNIDHLTGSYANSGGVIGSLIEWATNVGNFKVSEKQSKKYISYCMKTNFNLMRKLVKKDVVDSLADAFYFMAMERYLKKWIK